MASYYVDPVSGSDANAGTSEGAPIASYAKAGFLAALAAGDTVYQKRGTTYVGQVIPTTSGTSASRIKFRAYGAGERPVIDANGATNGAFYCSGLTGISIEGFELKNATSSISAGIHFLNCQAVDASDNYVHDCDYGIRVDNNTAGELNDVLIDGNTVEDTQQSGIVAVCGTSSGGRIGRLRIVGNTTRRTALGSTHPRAGIFVTNRAATWDETKAPYDIDVDGNTVVDSDDYGILCTGCAGGYVRRNDVSRCGLGGLNDTHGIAIHGGMGIEVSYNKVHDNGILAGGSNGSGVGIYLDQFNNVSQGLGNSVIGNEVYNLSRTGTNTAAYRSAGIFVYRNTQTLVSGNYVHDCMNGIVVRGETSGANSTNVSALNNTLRDITSYGVAVSTKADVVTIQNNIVDGATIGFQEQTGANAPTNVTRQYNCAANCSTYSWATGTEAAPASGSAGTGDITTDPGLSGLAIKASSSCANAALFSALARDFSGRKLKRTPDIGAQQYYAPRVAVGPPRALA